MGSPNGASATGRTLCEPMRRAAPVVDPSSQAASCAAVAARMRARVGWGGGILACCPRSPAPWDGHKRRAARSKENSKFRFQKARSDPPQSQNGQISGDRELVNFQRILAAKFQTHISNSGEQIPKHARQNSEDCRFPVSRNKVRSRGHRFLGTDFPILVSEFKFPLRSRI